MEIDLHPQMAALRLAGSQPIFLIRSIFLSFKSNAHSGLMVACHMSLRSARFFARPFAVAYSKNGEKSILGFTSSNYFGTQACIFPICVEMDQNYDLSESKINPLIYFIFLLRHASIIQVFVFTQ